LRDVFVAGMSRTGPAGLKPAAFRVVDTDEPAGRVQRVVVKDLRRTRILNEACWTTRRAQIS